MTLFINALWNRIWMQPINCVHDENAKYKHINSDIKTVELKGDMGGFFFIEKQFIKRNFNI